MVGSSCSTKTGKDQRRQGPRQAAALLTASLRLRCPAPAEVVALVPRVAAEGAAEAGVALNLILTLALTLPLSGAAGAVGAAHSQRQATKVSPLSNYQKMLYVRSLNILFHTWRL